MAARPAPLPDYDVYPDHRRPVRLEARGDRLAIAWSDGHESRFHWLWLRDNCACAHCLNPLTREQIFEIDSVAEDLQAGDMAIEADGVLRLAWRDDGHVSRYHPGWLRVHCYSAAARAGRRRPPPRTWDGGFVPSRHRADAVLRDEAALYDWLVALRADGLTLLEGLGRDEDMVERLANRIAFVRQTNFGRLFDVRSKPDANSNAYTALELPLHTDLPTREVAPGLQLLHCLVNETGGGDSILADGFRIAEALRAEAPEDFDRLAATPLAFRNTDRLDDYRWDAPVIGLDAEGVLSEIRFANFLRGPFDVAEDAMAACYRAYRRFARMTREPRFRLQLALAPGSCLAFDNRRVLHARTAFDPARGDRHLRGCYVDREELHSRIRILERSRRVATDNC